MFNKDNLKQNLLDLWRSHYQDDNNALMPLFYGSLKQHALLFVGLNPSFSEKGFIQLFQDTEFAGLNPNEFYAWKNRKNFDFEKAIKIEMLAREKYDRYFKPIKEIAQYVGLEWEHIDLFFERVTEQHQLNERIFEDRRGAVLTEFAEEQLKLSLKLIEDVEAKIIVVINAGASKILRDKWSESLFFDDRLGTYLVQLNERRVPVFFSSMLTGQRALDKGSFERLKWHVRMVMES